MYIYIYSQRQTKRVLRLTKHHLFIVVAFAAEVMMDDDAAVKFFVRTLYVCHIENEKSEKIQKIKSILSNKKRLSSVLKSSLSTR